MILVNEDIGIGRGETEVNTGRNVGNLIVEKIVRESAERNPGKDFPTLFNAKFADSTGIFLNAGNDENFIAAYQFSGIKLEIGENAVTGRRLELCRNQ